MKKGKGRNHRGRKKNHHFVEDLAVKLKERQKGTITGMQTRRLFDNKVLTFRARHLCYGK